MKAFAPITLSAIVSIVTLLGTAVTAQSDYAIRADDVLDITLWNQSGLRSKYTVEPDGGFTFPFIGRIKAAGLSTGELAAELKRRLADGYFKDPQVTVSVEQFHTGRIFIFGGVGNPGAYPVTPGMTLVEALAKAGYGAASEAIIVRTRGATGPVLPGQNSSSNVIKVNLREFEKDLESGELSRNISLVDGDTIFVPRNDPNRIFVTGEVKNPGAFSIPEGTTVLQAVTLAGGVTENAAINRVRIIRLIDGEMKTVRVKLDSIVEPGDTIVVPERYF